MSNQGTDANDRVVNMLGKFISHCLANFVISFAVVTIGGLRPGLTLMRSFRLRAMARASPGACRAGVFGTH